MSEILTAAEFFNNNLPQLAHNWSVTTEEKMIGFAKMHVEFQRKEIIADLKKEHTSDSHIESIVNNAYNSENIK